MKNIYLTIIIAFISFGAYAQQNKGDLIKLDLGLFNGIRVAYEKPIADAFSIGSAADFYYGGYSGFKIEPFARFYIGGQCPEGLYLQGRFLYGNFTSSFFHYNTRNGLDIIDREVSFSSVGGGFDLGYQWLSGRKNNIVIDLSLGAQAMGGYNGSIVQNNQTYNSANVGFNVWGPGAVFNPHLLIGYKF